MPNVKKPKPTGKYKEKSAKPVKKPSASGPKVLAKAGEAQRREMARTRMQAPERRMAAKKAAEAKQRDADKLARQRMRQDDKKTKEMYGR